MYFDLLQKNLPDYFKPRENILLKSHEIKYGFNSNINFEYSDSHGSIENARKGALMTNSASMVAKYVGVIEPDNPIYDGYRNDIVDTNGSVDVNLLEDLMAKALGRKYVNASIADSITKELSTRNAVSLLYNLLRLLVIKSNGHLIYKPQDKYYDNGHVSILYEQIFGGEETALSDAVEISPASVSCSTTMFDEAITNNSLAWKGTLTQGCYNAIRDAAGTWFCNAPFGIAHSSPALTDEHRGLMIVANQPRDRSKIGYDVNDVVEAITIVTTANKLYTDFDIAYLMVAQVFTTPKPRCAESAAWFANEATVFMPELSIVTGQLPFLLSGSPYVRDDSWRETFDSWRKSRDSIFYHSLVLNEDVYVELSSVARVRDSEHINSGNFTELSIDGAPLAYRGILTDLSLISMRRGYDIQLPYASSCGLARSTDFIHESYIDVPVTITDTEADAYYNLLSIDLPAIIGQKRTLRVTSITPPIYPVFSYGLNTDDLFSDKLDDEITITIDTLMPGVITITDPKVFSKFMNILRMMGNDVTATERLTQKKVTNWTDNGVGRFIYTDVQFGAQCVFDIKQEDIKQRMHNWVSIGAMYGEVKLTYKMSSLRARIFSGNTDLKVSGGFITTVKPTSQMTFNEEILSSPDAAVIHALKKNVLPDFRFVRLEIPTMSGIPVPIFGRQRVQQVDPGNMEPTSQEAGLDVPPGEIDMD